MPLLLIDEPKVHFGSEQLSRLDGFETRHADGKRTSIAVFPQVATINVFVGANNAGKSRLLRQLFAERVIQIESAEDDRKLLVLHALASHMKRLVATYAGSQVHCEQHFVGLLRDISNM